jgi:hypothetical protein
MSLVFQNIDPPPPSLPGECVPPPPFGAGEDTLAGWRKGWGGVNILEDADTALDSTYESTLCLLELVLLNNFEFLPHCY